MQRRAAWAAAYNTKTHLSQPAAAHVLPRALQEAVARGAADGSAGGFL